MTGDAPLLRKSWALKMWHGEEAKNSPYLKHEPFLCVQRMVVEFRLEIPTSAAGATLCMTRHRCLVTLKAAQQTPTTMEVTSSTSSRIFPLAHDMAQGFFRIT